MGGGRLPGRPADRRTLAGTQSLIKAITGTAGGREAAGAAWQASPPAAAATRHAGRSKAHHRRVGVEQRHLQRGRGRRGRGQGAGLPQPPMAPPAWPAWRDGAVQRLTCAPQMGRHVARASWAAVATIGGVLPGPVVGHQMNESCLELEQARGYPIRVERGRVGPREAPITPPVAMQSEPRGIC